MEEVVLLEDQTPILNYADRCPVHGGEERKEYNFGNPADPTATVMVFEMCSCAVCYVPWPANTYHYFTRWGKAVGFATMQRMLEAR